MIGFTLFRWYNTTGLGSVFSPCVLLSAQTERLAIWPTRRLFGRSLSVPFGSSRLTMFINGSFNLTLPVSLALYQLELPVLSKALQLRQVALQLFGTLSFELHTRPLPATHVEVGYCQQNDRSLFCSITVRQLYQRLFRSHNPLSPGSIIPPIRGTKKEKALSHWTWGLFSLNQFLLFE